ncbi:hypothetical protein C8R44DRAFT_407139 [Mycena epipterygia]|nr:hypothetical protein C8R44DRAFT_407139 [Mycena epipterygia]
MNGHLFPNNVPPASLPNPDSQQSSQQPPGMNGHLFPNNVPPASLQQPFQPNQMPQFTQQPGIQQPFYYQPPTQYPSGLIVDPSVYSMVVMDILSNKGLLQGLLPSWPGPPPPHGPILQNGMQPGFFVPPMTNPPQMYSQMPAAYNQSASPPSVSGPLPQSLSRISSADIKGKGKGTSYASRDSSGSSRTLASSSVSVDKLFTSDSGEPLTFYVAIEVHNRNLTLNHIKRHGGQISTQMTANYAILSSRSKDFETLLETVLSSGGIPVKPAFVDESVEQGTLLDPSQYQFDVPAKLLRKVVPPSPAKSDAEKKAAANVRKAKARRAKKDAAVKAEKTSPGLSSQRVPSPSPPPEHTRVLHNGIKYRYPEVEDEYVLRYAAVLFERDRQMSYAALSAKLHAKMPHHSDKAWNNHISQTMRDDVENVRKRAIIAYRKEEHSRSNAEEPAAKRMKPSKPVDGPQAPADDPQTPANDPQAPAGDPQAPADDPQPAGDPQAKALADEEHDLNAVAHFFANGGDVEQTDGEDEEQSVKDARVWARLTEQTACRTEASWEVFYNKHHPRVMELYQMLAEEESPPQ